MGGGQSGEALDLGLAILLAIKQGRGEVTVTLANHETYKITIQKQ